MCVRIKYTREYILEHIPYVHHRMEGGGGVCACVRLTIAIIFNNAARHCPNYTRCSLAISLSRKVLCCTRCGRVEQHSRSGSEPLDVRPAALSNRKKINMWTRTI